jgi:hypothetical protein
MKVKEWLKSQFEWFKLVFAEDKMDNAPSHKNFIALALLIVFCIGYLKTIFYMVAVQGKDLVVPDMPPGWQMVFLGILGISSLRAASEKISEHRYLSSINGNGETKPEKKETEEDTSDAEQLKSSTQ